MTRFVALAGLALVLAACGAQPMPGAAPRGAAAIAALGENVFVSKDIRYVCEQMLKRQEKAAANKTNIARMGTALAHVQTLAKEQKRKEVLAIADQALEAYHALAKANPGNLSAIEAAAQKAVLISAFGAILAAMPAEGPTTP